MSELKCPNCNKFFSIDESDYLSLVSQVRTSEFNKEIKEKVSAETEKQRAKSETEKIKTEKEYAEKLSEKDAEIERLKSQISNFESVKKIAVSDALKEKESEISKINEEIIKLNAEISQKDTESRLAVATAVQEKEKEISDKNTQIMDLNSQLTLKDKERELSEKLIAERYDIQLKLKDEQIQQYKDFKARQSTKMIGESLEQHCSNQFNSLRATAFRSAYFEKDNDARTGSKGDFIFRDFAEDGTEYVSIMFEMKNEADTTASKHKNEHFFRELDKDRKEKNCEYAVLVSLLESDNDFYNNGIVDVSYMSGFEKMYVIRPQFFIPLITLLRNAAMNSLQYQRELAIVKNQQLDIVHFEENMDEFKKGFARNYELASKKFKTAIEEIDKTIEHLQKTRDALLSSENNLRLANNKAEDLSIKKLTKNAPSVAEMFNEIK